MSQDNVIHLSDHVMPPASPLVVSIHDLMHSLTPAFVETFVLASTGDEGQVPTRLREMAKAIEDVAKQIEEQP